MTTKETKPKTALKARKAVPKVKKEVEVKEQGPKAMTETKEIKKGTAEEKVAVAEAVVMDEADDQADENGKTPKSNRYYEAVGRRKTATARVRLFTRGDKSFIVNDKPLEKYFPGAIFKSIIEAPLIKMNIGDRFKITAVVKGGGINAQAEAIRHGIARALVMFNLDFKKRLKKSGYLTRDSRMKERKKPGLRKARRAPQWAKR
jgi:small subunit ribosomal protein S9